MTAIDDFNEIRPRLDAWLASHAPTTLVCDERGGDLASDNLLIHADSLEAARSLAASQRETVRLVYIDPPYNTGNQSWVYSDAMASEVMHEWLGTVVGARDAQRSVKWMCMMYPRLIALRELMRRDGVICVSIDDSEVGNLRYLMDTVFEGGFVSQITWQTKASSNDAKLVSNVHEYILVYARDVSALSGETWTVSRREVEMTLEEVDRLLADSRLSDAQRTSRLREWQRDQIALDQIALEEEQGLDEKTAREKARKRWTGVLPYSQIDAQGVWRGTPIIWPNNQGGPRYDVPHPVTGLACKVPARGWRWTEESMREQLAQGRIVFGKDHTTTPVRKLYLTSAQQPLKSVIVDITGHSAIVEIGEIFNGEQIFDYPKPVALIRRLIELTSSPGDTVLDAFAGSGTTAHAVLDLNAAHPDRPPRRFICIQLPERYATASDRDFNQANARQIRADEMARRASGEIFRDITRVRVDRVIDGYDSPKGRVPGLGGSYSAWHL
jgi:adenine-specific DNA-methyltransferase